MGCGASTESGSSPNGGHETVLQQNGPRAADAAELGHSNAIDRELDRARQQEEFKVKLLLLGAGESGTSTIFKQMRLLHGSPWTEDDLRMYGVLVRSNIVTAVRKLCQLLRNLELEGQLAVEPGSESEDDMTPKQAFDRLCAHLVDGTAPPLEEKVHGGGADDWVGHSARAGLGPNKDAQQFLQLWRPMKVLWESKAMKEVWQKRAAVNIIDGHRDYLQDISRIASPTFCPTTQDILLARVKTTQPVILRYRIDGIDFEIIDVGGLLSDRSKWIDYFDNLTGVIVVAALSEYDQTHADSKRTNRLVEALELFRSVCNNRAFADASMVLFLNKKDVFAEKILYSDIQAQNPFNDDFAGPPKDFNSGLLYFIQKFKECLISDNVYGSFVQVTCALDTNKMEFVLDSTLRVILSRFACPKGPEIRKLLQSFSFSSTIEGLTPKNDQ